MFCFMNKQFVFRNVVIPIDYGSIKCVCLDMQVSSEPIYIVTEFMCNGSLLDYLQKGEGKNSTLTNHVDMATQVSFVYFCI